MECFGNNKRKNTVIPEPDYKTLMKMTHYSKAELKELFGRFETLADVGTGTIDKIAFLSIPELACCCVSSMIFDRESVRNLKNTLEFVDFVVILDLLSRNTHVEEKAKYLFDLFKNPNLEHFTVDEYGQLLEVYSAASSIPPTILKDVTAQAWKVVSKEGKLSLKDFAAHQAVMDIHAVMTVDFLV